REAKAQFIAMHALILMSSDSTPPTLLGGKSCTGNHCLSCVRLKLQKTRLSRRRTGSSFTTHLRQMISSLSERLDMKWIQIPTNVASHRVPYSPARGRSRMLDAYPR